MGMLTIAQARYAGSGGYTWQVMNNTDIRSKDVATLDFPLPVGTTVRPWPPSLVPASLP